MKYFGIGENRRLGYAVRPPDLDNDGIGFLPMKRLSPEIEIINQNHGEPRFSERFPRAASPFLLPVFRPRLHTRPDHENPGDHKC